MSGRLLSLTVDLDTEAIGFVRRVRELATKRGKPLTAAFGYYGHMFATPAAIRRVDPNNIDVTYTPIGSEEEVPDNAHADITMYGKTAAAIPGLRSKLQDELKVFAPDQTGELENRRI